ncbi:hypothetical protein [Pontibacter sp. H249]|uniref:hypothetical protein n=1 Tax=Pontibacter sp. H249 TaxID=3133420 RepID=UPI0030C3F6F6
MEKGLKTLDDAICLEDAPHFVLEYLESKSYLRLIWKRKPNTLEYKHAITHWFHHLQTQQAERTLFYNLKAGLISDEDKVWSEAFIKKLLPKSNLKKMASVIADNIYQRMLIQKMHTVNKTPQYQLQFFTNESEAYNWLLS